MVCLKFDTFHISFLMFDQFSISTILKKKKEKKKRNERISKN